MARTLFAITLCFLAVCATLVPTGDGADEDATSRVEALRNKMEFRDATLREAVDFLNKASVELDTKSPPAERGVKFVIKPEVAGSQVSDPRITVNLMSIPLIEALKYVTGLADLKYQIEPDEVSIVARNEASEVLVTKEWRIPPDLIPDVAKSEAKIADREIAKNWLIANGVVFDGAATAIYIVKSSRLIVRNTQDQLDLVDTILNLGKEPSNLVEIECRLVEIQDEESATGMFPLMAGNRPGHSVGPQTIRELLYPSLHSRQRVFGVFTDPQMQMLDRLLAGKQGVAQFSMPKVIVNSGQPAVIEFIRQYDNPLKEMPPQVSRVSGSAGAAKLPKSNSKLVSSPSFFPNRNVAVRLEVKPVIGPDGYTLDLTLRPQVTEFDGFVGDESPFISRAVAIPSGAPVAYIVTPRMKPPLLFSTHPETTHISIYDGCTVVFNELIDPDAKKEAETKGLVLRKVPVVDLSSRMPSLQHDERAQEEVAKDSALALNQKQIADLSGRMSGPAHLTRGLALFVTTRMLSADHKPLRAEGDQEK